MRLIIILCLLSQMANAQTRFSFSSFLEMHGNDQIHEGMITVQIDSSFIVIQTRDTSIKHRIISSRWNPYMYQMEYKVTCGGKLRVDYLWDEKTIESFFFKCPGTHLFSSLSFQEAVKNNEYD